MVQEVQIKVSPKTAYNIDSIKDFISKEKAINIKEIKAIHILKRSIDARQRNIYINLTIRVFINEIPEYEEYTKITYPDVSDAKSVLVVGAGPGGLFASLRLIELGLKPILIERGKMVSERHKDISRISKEQSINPESNYSFGEGGAGAFSDGKLYTRSKKRGSVERILNIFCQHGASTSILADAHPHIGTDKLPKVIENMRRTIISSGGEVHFETKMTSFIIQENRVIGICTKSNIDGSEREFHGSVILATGHSARDIYRYMANSDIDIEAKGLAIGVRLEHPSHLIDQIQYHSNDGRGKYLPAAEYSFVTQVKERGVYSFCMCPGGFIVPAATENEQLVVNGMSPSNRGSRWSNSGMVVELRPEDITGNDPLRMMYYQERIEYKCWVEGGKQQTAPAQRMQDFVKATTSKDLPKSSYSSGIVSSNIHEWLPHNITSRLQEGFVHFGNMRKGFLTNEAVMIGVESRTSAPVRITRDKKSLQHIKLKGLYPCGEGAGYAGGIVSAGIDGERCAEMCKLNLDNFNMCF